MGINGNLKRLINEMGLELIFIDMARSGIYFSESKTIFLSAQLLEENSDFEISHELGHCKKNMKNFLPIILQVTPIEES